MLYKDLLKGSDQEIIHSYKEHGRAKTEEKFRDSMVFLGKGVNARAFALPSGNIIRVEASMNSGGWHKWMQKVVLHDETDMTARVGAYETFRNIDSGGTMSVSIQEQLYPIRSNVGAFKLLQGVGNMISYICENSDPERRWEDAVKDMPNLKRFFPRETVLPFSRLIQASGLCLNDTHMGNVMFRKRGERVILTDPVN